MTAGKQLAMLILHIVDAVHHGLIGGEDAVSRVIILLLTQIRHRQIRQEVHKASLGLGHQGIPVSQEQDVLHPAVLRSEEHTSELQSR